MQPVIGSNPPEIRMDGYGALQICDNQSGNIAWSIGEFRETYLATVVVGVVPDGFLETNRDEPFGCVWSTGHSPVGVGFTVFGREPFSNNWYLGETYCLDADGAVTVCP
jgi:hypothetical protein